VPRVKVAYLGPAGTFSEDALRVAAGDDAYEALPLPSVYDAILAVAEGGAERALVPFENSIEGSVRVTLDTLALDAPAVAIVGEHDQQIRHSLIAARSIDLGEIRVVVSHPQPLAQCARFLRSELGTAELRAAPSTAEAVKEVIDHADGLAAIGPVSAAELYGCVVLREGIEDADDNVTRFIWLAPRGVAASGGGPWRTSLCFAELGADHPGALVEALTEFSDRDVNLTRIESRPLRQGLGRYMFFVDLEGDAAEPPVAAAIDALRTKAESVRVLGTYPVAGPGIPGA
jgi:prephenate dehydratase